MTCRDLFLVWGKKLFTFLLSLFFLTVTVFYAAHLAPGDPLVSYYGSRAEKLRPDERLWAEEKLGLDQPVHVQYGKWLSQALRGDFGISFKYKTSVLEVIGDRIGNSLLLGGVGFGVIFVLGLMLGILCAYFADGWPDRCLCKIGTVFSCIPEFWLSLALILVFSVTLDLLPSSGAYSVTNAQELAHRATHLVLPLTVVVSNHLWYHAYVARNKILEEVRADYVLLAKSKGLSKGQILLRHCLPNIMPTYLSVMATSVPHILGGTYVVEMVFSYPGLGALSYESARYQDHNLLMALCLITGVTVMVCSAAAQIVSQCIDPRIGAKDACEVWEVEQFG